MISQGELLAKNSPVTKRFFLRSAPLDVSVLEGMPQAIEECREMEIFEANEIFGLEEDGGFFFQSPGKNIFFCICFTIYLFCYS